MENLLPKTKPITQAQSFARAVAINDITYIMLKRRDSGGHMLSMSLKRVFCIFAMLDKFLGGDGLLAEKTEFWKADDTFDENLLREYAAQETPDEILDEIIASMPNIPEDRQGKWTIIVFSEAFFSDDPWNSAEVEKVKKFCQLLTNGHKNVVISVNFLHKYEEKSDTPSRRKPPAEKYIVTNDAARLKQNRSSNLRFSNCSLIFWKGVPLSCYRKTTYKMEAESEDRNEDNILKHGYGYDFGDWKSYAPPELAAASDDHREFAALFNSGRRQIIVSRTCYDMNFTQTLAKSVKLLILTADGAPSPMGWKDKICNTKACVSDADRGLFTIISGIFKTVPQFNSSFFTQDKLLYTMSAYYGGVCDEDISSCCGNCC
jgi:hypothetical protein